MQDVPPVKPRILDPFAVDLLDGLRRFPAARLIVLGGYFALKHYCDYRGTHDVDAWWDAASTEAERVAAREAVKHVLSEIGQGHGLELASRQFGDTESWELRRAGRKLFSFQISRRTVQLDPYRPSPWPPLQIETLAENIGSKMNALVQRGAPRDFVDVRQVIEAGLATPADCWQLWSRKNPDLKVSDAHAEVARHLAELEKRRPLDSIGEPADRNRAVATRTWFRDVFLKLNSHGT